LEILILGFIVPIIFLLAKLGFIQEINPINEKPELCGASPEILSKLLRIKYTANLPVDSCIICMENYRENETVVEMPCDKRHCFHENCIMTWLEKANKCPMCNAKLDESSFQCCKSLSISIE